MYGRARVVITLDEITFEVRTGEVKHIDELGEMIAAKVDEKMGRLVNQELSVVRDKLAAAQATIQQLTNPHAAAQNSGAVRRQGQAPAVPTDGPARRAAARAARAKKPEKQAAAE